MSSSSEFDLSEGEEDLFSAVLDSVSSSVEIGVAFPVTLPDEWIGEFREAALEENVNSSQDPSYVPGVEPSSELSELSLSQADPVSGGEAEGAAYLSWEDRGPVGGKTFDSAESLRAFLQGSDDVRGSDTSRASGSGTVLARHILSSLLVEIEGWCRATSLKPSKANGYVQLSYKGKNKFAVLQDVLLWANGVSKGGGLQASHLCNRPTCTIPEHVCAESARDNNSRKGCLGWVRCSPFCRNCDGKKSIGICPHRPRCIVFHQEYSSHEDFVDNGICHWQT